MAGAEILSDRKGLTYTANCVLFIGLILLHV